MSRELEMKIEALIEKRNVETEALKKLLAAFDKDKKKKTIQKKR